MNLSNLTAEQIRELQTALTPKTNRYIPFAPTAKQTAALLMNETREMLYGGAPLALDTPVLTVNRGWQTIESIVVGDYVFTPKGKATKVVAKTDIFNKPCYQLTFDRGRESIICSEDHLWFVLRRRQDRQQRVAEFQTAKQIYERYSNQKPKNRGSLYTLPVAWSLQYPEQELPIDPYVFGIWLGDGNGVDGRISSVDEEIREQFKARGYDVYFTSSSIQHDRPDLHPEGRLSFWWSERLRQELRSIGFLKKDDLWEAKYIPDYYMQASEEQRVELLKGLMDSDGHADEKGRVYLTFADAQLAEQSRELIVSLGMPVEIHIKIDRRPNNPRYPRGIYISYNMFWTANREVFHLSRKVQRQKVEASVYGKQHFISDIEPAETVPTQCLQVEDPSHTFLIGENLILSPNCGGGKSVFLLMAALQYVDVPGYSAILFRRTFSDLMLPGALIPMAHAWLGSFITSGEVRWQDKEKRFTFNESGATLSFGYLENKNDHTRYQGAEFQFVGVDEATHILPESYRYMFSRLRRIKGSNLPIRMRATANPGGQFGDYYYQRFFVEKKGLFLPAGLRDNPHLDVDTYRESLAELDPITRAQLEEGDWEIRPIGDLFDKEWIYAMEPHNIPKAARWVRFWDLAAIDPKYRRKSTNTEEPDWTVGFKLGYHEGMYYIGDIIRVQKSPGDVEQLIAETAAADGFSCAIRMEEEGGASGIANTERYARKVLPGYNYAGVRPVVSKIERARPVAAACQVGSVFISARCRYIVDFFAQLEAFPAGANDDMVDAFSGAFAHFKPMLGRISAPKPSLELDKQKITQRHLVETPLTRRGSYWHRAMSNR